MKNLLVCKSDSMLATIQINNQKTFRCISGGQKQKIAVLWQLGEHVQLYFDVLTFKLTTTAAELRYTRKERRQTHTFLVADGPLLLYLTFQAFSFLHVCCLPSASWRHQLQISQTLSGRDVAKTETYFSINL